jgi:hypothetical protein
MPDFEKTTMAKTQIEDVLVEDERRSDESKATMPTSLAGLSDAEFASMGRKATVKMDIMIMPCLVVMYIMNYLDRQNIAAAKLADIDKDLRLSDVQYQTCISLLFVGYSKSASRWAAGSIFQLTSPNSPHAGSLQYHCRESQVPRHLHLCGYGCLGHDLRLHGRSPKLYWSCARSILHWIRRGRILSWCALLHVLILQPEAVRIPRRRIILRFSTRQCLWRSVRHWHFEA